MLSTQRLSSPSRDLVREVSAAVTPCGDPPPIPEPPAEGNDPARWPHLDAFRILGVSGVVWVHMSEDYLNANGVFGQQWGLQILMMISGMLWSLSRADPCAYAMRLMLFFFLGVFSNWLSYVAVGADWRSNMYDVVFQMWFVLGVAVCVLSTAPLKYGLNQRGNAIWKATAGYFIFSAAMISLARSSSWTPGLQYLLITYGGAGGRYYSRYADYMGIYLCQFSSCFSLTSLACACTVRPTKDFSETASEPRGSLFIAWLVIVCTYVPSILFYQPLGAWLHDVFMFLLGFVVQRLSMFGQWALAQAISAYWPLLMIFPIGVMQVPFEPARRIDMFPFHDPQSRARFQSIELIFTLTFAICATPANTLDRKVPIKNMCKDPYNALGWLNKWALFAYMCHMAFLNILPEPIRGVAVYVCAFFFYAEEKLRSAYGMPKSAEVFGYAWLVVLIPYSIVLCESFNTSGALGWLCYFLVIMHFNRHWASSRTKRTEARAYRKTAENAFPDGVTPLAAAVV